MQEKFTGLVVRCADHYPDLIRVFCPVQYNKQLQDTFSDPTLFRTLPDDPTEYSKLLHKHMNPSLRVIYKWGYDPKGELPRACV
jgi:hypothetical protein